MKKQLVDLRIIKIFVVAANLYRVYSVVYKLIVFAFCLSQIRLYLIVNLVQLALAALDLMMIMAIKRI